MAILIHLSSDLQLLKLSAAIDRLFVCFLAVRTGVGRVE